ncbi:DUF4221 family protein [Roseivirga echinicomitans]
MPTLFLNDISVLKKVSVLCFILFTVSCENNLEYPLGKDPQYNIEILPIEGTLKLPVDSTTSNISSYLAYYHNRLNESAYLVSVNTFMNELQFFDLTTGQQSFSLPIEMNGNKGIDAVSAVDVINLDSIIVFPSQGNNIYIIDSSNQKFTNIDYQASLGYSNASPSMLFFSSNPYLEDQKLYVKTLFETNFRTISNTALSEIHLGYSVDLITGQVIDLPHFYPPDYFAEGMKHFDFSASITENGFVYSFFGDHDLYFSNNQDEKLRKVYGKSKYLDEDLPLFPADGDRLDRAMYLSIMDHYGNLIYDRYREVYYRFCYPSLEKSQINEMKEVLDNLQNPRQFSIQIFDRELNIVGETLFERNKKYLPKNAFVGKERLYISTKHSENEENEENEFSFDLFKMKKLD